MMITSSTRLSKQETEKLLKLKEETGTCISSLIREAVCDYLATKEGIQAKQIDDCFFQEYEEPSTEVSSP